MAYNIRVDEACRYSITDEKIIDIDDVPESLRSHEGSNMVYYEIKIGCDAFQPVVNLDEWDPAIVKERMKTYNISKVVANTSSVRSDKQRSRQQQQQQRAGLSRKQIIANKKNRKKAKKSKPSIMGHAMRAKSYFSLESGITVIEKKSYCLLSDRPYDGDYYVLFMTHPLDGKKTDTNISYSTDPIYEIFLHNNLLMNDRSTSAAAPFWGADAILGPFTSLRRSIKCSEGVVEHTRGDTSKRNKCIELHRDFDVNLYLSTITDKTTAYADYVYNNTPPSYIKAYQDRYIFKKKKTSH